MAKSPTTSTVISTGAAVCCAFLFALPLWWISVSALRPTQDIFRYLSPLSIWTLLPLHPTIDHVRKLWQGPFGLALGNSVLVAAATVLIGLVVCAAAAFALAAIEFPGRNLVFAITVISFLVPFDAVAVSLFGILRRIHLQNSYTGLVLPGIGNGLAIFLLRQSFLSLPKDLCSAAMMDGAGWFAILWRIYIPLSVPSLVSASIILFVFQWQSYLWPLLIAPDPGHKLASVAIAEFSTSYNVDYAQLFAGAVFISLIPMVVLVGLQRLFQDSIASTGGKE